MANTASETLHPVPRRVGNLWELATEAVQSGDMTTFHARLVDLIELIENFPDAPISIEILATTYYFAFQACLLGEYPTQDRASKMKEFRNKLITVSLEMRAWNVADVALNLNAPNSLDNLTPNGGWLPTDKRETLSNLDDRLNTSNQIVRYTNLRAVDFDFKEAKISIIADEYDPEIPDSPCLFTSLDVNELIGMGEMRGGPALSLNHIDRNCPFLPFQRMEFSPSYMYSSRLMRCMFICDYMLKWMNVGSEVQFKPDLENNSLFEVRSIDDGFMKLLPKELKEMVGELNQALGTKHGRVWFESDRAKIFQVDDAETDTETYHFGDLRMLFKFQQQGVDKNGNMVDVNDDAKEGWPCYVLYPQDYERLEKHQLSIPVNKNFIVVQRGSAYECSFWKPNLAHQLEKTAKIDVSEDDDELAPLLDRLCRFERHHGLILTNKFEAKSQADDDQEDNANQRIEVVYKVLRIACERSGQEHGYSPMFCFCQKVTELYDALAHHIPEFARLRELSKLVAAVKLMAMRRNELKEEAETVAAGQGWIKWMATSSKERKRLNAFEKALKDLQFGVLEQDNYSTVELEEKLGHCYWVPKALAPMQTAPNGDGTTPQLPIFISGGTSAERRPKRVKIPTGGKVGKRVKAQRRARGPLTPEELQKQQEDIKKGYKAENYHLDWFWKKNPHLSVLAQIPIPTALGWRKIDFLFLDPRTGEMFAHEVKAANAKRNRVQRAKDEWIEFNIGGKNYRIRTTEFNYPDESVYKDYSDVQTKSESIPWKGYNRRKLYLPLEPPKGFRSGSTPPRPPIPRIVLPPTQKIIIPTSRIIIPSNQGIIRPTPRIILPSSQAIITPVPRLAPGEYSRPPVGNQTL